MRITVTASSAGTTSDLIIDCDEDTPLPQIIDAIEGEVGVRIPPQHGDGRIGEHWVNGAVIDAPASSTHELSPGGMQLHVIGGSNAGVIYHLPIGRHVVGRGSVISWDDDVLSRRHVQLDISAAGVTVTDLGSVNGTFIEGNVCPQGHAVPWEPGQLLEIGDSIAMLREAAVPDAVTESADPGWRTFLRPPRIQPRYSPPQVDIPRAPQTERKRRFPLITMVVPLAASGVMFAVTRQTTFLLFALMSPAMLAANYFADRYGTAKDHKAAVAEYESALRRAQAQLDAAITTEQNRLRQAQPDAAEALLTSVLPGRRLWERRRHDPDALRLRLGLADRDSSVIVTGDDRQAGHRLRLVPHMFDLKESPVVGIAGELPRVDGLLRWLIAQVAVSHTPGEVSIVFLTSTGTAEWRWLHWLPHLRPEDPDSCTAMIGHDAETVAARVAGLIELIRSREELVQAQRSLTADAFPAVVVVMHGYRSLRTMADVASVVASGPPLGVYTICTDETELTLPETAAAVCCIRPDAPTMGTLRVASTDPVDGILLEQVSILWAERFSRAMAPLKDVSGVDAGEQLPDSVRLLTLLGLDPPTPDAIHLRWMVNPQSTVMTLGAGLNGPFTLDLKADGPHGLIAGMTGSGKTELLQTLIASLAVTNRPEWLNFVLIDYKGDSAFLDCVRLPHTVGKVNDLDPFLVERALASLEAELDIRKGVLAAVGVKDIEDYHDLLQLEPQRPPLPRLVLVIDEFAELAKDLPDFMEGLVSIAQQGRSLGVHLLLATQRPSGVVSPSIRANTNMRLALRVTDVSDSADVLHSSDAAKIPRSLPGRGFARLGANALVAFQSGRIGGRRPGAASIGFREPLVAPVTWRSIGYPTPRRDPDRAQRDVADTDLSALVSAIESAAALAGIAPQRQPWLDPLPPMLLWSEADLPPPTAAVSLPFGQCDIPREQSQRPATFDLVRDSHMFVIGAPQSGRSQVLRALSASIAQFTSPAEVHVYGLDCGTGALNAAAALPHCGAVVARSEADRAVRLLTRIAAELDRRQRTLADRGWGDITDQRRFAPDPWSHLVFMIDRWEGFTATFGEVNGATDTVMRLLREGASAGIHLVITGDRSLAVNARMSAMTENKFILRLADKTDYLLVGIKAKAISDKLVPGRGFSPGTLETQVFLIDPDPSGQAQSAALQQIGADAAGRHHTWRGPRPFSVDALPSRVTIDEALAMRSDPAMLVVGVGGDELTALGPIAGRTPCFVVAGPSRSGRSSVLLGVARSAIASGYRVVVVAPRPSPLHALEDVPGVLAVISSKDNSQINTGALDAITAPTASNVPTVVVVDDAEVLRDSSADDFFLRAVRGQVVGVTVVLAGHLEGLGLGLSGWQVEAKKARHGLLLCPQALGDGDLIGARLPRAMVGGLVRPSQGVLHLGDGVLTQVATVMPTGC